MTPPGPLRIERFVCGPLGNNVYLLIDEETGTALAIDPALDGSEQVVAAVEQHGVTLGLVVATHAHWDHIAEAAALCGRTGAALAAHQLDAARIEQPARSSMFPQLEIAPATVGRRLEDGDAVALGRHTFTVLHTPGHTPGSICLYDAEQSLLLSGDTLFAGSYGRYDLPGGDAALLGDSLRRLAQLPAATRVLPGHGDYTTIGRETWLRRPPL